jgi:hypothetical protein
MLNSWFHISAADDLQLQVEFCADRAAAPGWRLQTGVKTGYCTHKKQVMEI